MKIKILCDDRVRQLEANVNETLQELEKENHVQSVKVNVSSKSGKSYYTATISYQEKPVLPKEIPVSWSKEEKPKDVVEKKRKPTKKKK